MARVWKYRRREGRARITVYHRPHAPWLGRACLHIGGDIRRSFQSTDRCRRCRLLNKRAMLRRCQEEEEGVRGRPARVSSRHRTTERCHCPARRYRNVCARNTSQAREPILRADSPSRFAERIRRADSP